MTVSQIPEGEHVIAALELDRVLAGGQGRSRDLKIERDVGDALEAEGDELVYRLFQA